MRTVLIIGIGAGDPEYLTVQAIKALNRVDTFFVVDKGERKDELARLRSEICERYIERPYRTVSIHDPERDRTAIDYSSAVAEWRQKRLEAYESALERDLEEDGVGGFLVWGDPSLYDGTMSIMEEIAARGPMELQYEVIPGISSVQALAARHKVPLNRVGESIHITTGRRLSQDLRSAPDNVVVMLDGQQAFSQVDGRDLEIYWGANLGTDDEVLLSGLLDDVAGEIQAVRAGARSRIGWIMDTYLLRKRER
jgi:precorrin-6A synthase